MGLHQKRHVRPFRDRPMPLLTLPSKDQILNFRPMDDFMSHVIGAIRTDGGVAVRVFPPDSQVLYAFADRIANEVVSPPRGLSRRRDFENFRLQVGEYITPLLSHARSVSNEVFLKATAATFVQAWRMVDVLVEVAASGPDIGTAQGSKSGPRTGLTRHQAEDIV